MSTIYSYIIKAHTKYIDFNFIQSGDNMNCLKIIFVYIGLIIGAGFASGREICEYFNFCSNTDYTGVCIASILFIFVCYAILKKSMKYELYTISDYVKHTLSFSKILQKFFLVLIFFDLTCGLIVMLSSCGEIFTNVFGIPKLAGAVILSALCFIVFIFDIKGIAAINIILVPIITVTILFISIFSILSKIYSPTFFLTDFLSGSGRNMIFLAVCYVSYNTLTAASVLSPLIKEVKDRKTILISSAIAGSIIGLLIFLVWFAIGMNFSTVWYESFPLQKLAGLIDKNFESIYSICLMMSIFTTAVSEGYGILSYFNIITLKRRIIISVLLFVIILPFSMINFAYLVKHLYYILGSLGMLWMLVVLIDYLRDLKH